MQFEISTIVLGSVAGISLASAAASIYQCLSLKKRLSAVEAGGGVSSIDSSEEYGSLAGRISSIGESISLLQSGMSEMERSVSSLRARSDAGRLVKQAEEGGTLDSDRRKPRFKSEWESGAPLNLNRRGQMLRLHRRGESIQAIASALGISQGEVKLTIRMQELSSDMPEQDNSQDRF